MEENNKRILKNTVYLYIRMLIMMGLSFFTTRIVLDKLGVSDYGVNNLVAGFVSSFKVIESMLAGSTRRFLAYSLGLHDINKSGAYVLLNLIPLVGQVALLIMLLQENEVDKKKVVDDPINNMDDKGFYLTAAVFIGIILVILLPLLLNGTL